MLALEADELFGYGSWNHRNVTLDGEPSNVIFVPWFGIQHRFRGAQTSSGESAAGVLYATLEQAALGHPQSNAAKPILLDCHADNDRGLAFWESRGFEPLELVETPSGRYHRMRR